MPSRRVHNYWSRQILGQSFDEIHRVLDAPVAWMGRSHRRLFHNFTDAAILARMVSDDPLAPLAAAIHIRLDEMCSKDPYFKANLERLARLDSELQSNSTRQPRLYRYRRR